MRNIVVIYLLLINFSLFSQDNLYKDYTWDEALKMNRDSVFSITFVNQKLTEVPESLIEFKRLKRLNFGKNKLVNLPDFFIQFNELEYLNLEKNKFVVFPNEICQLYALKDLILNRNDIVSLPECIERLDALKYIDIWATPINQFPDAFKNMESLVKIDARGISHGKKFQEKWREELPKIKILFDTPCNCLE